MNENGQWEQLIYLYVQNELWINDTFTHTNRNTKIHSRT